MVDINVIHKKLGSVIRILIQFQYIWNAELRKFPPEIGFSLEYISCLEAELDKILPSEIIAVLNFHLFAGLAHFQKVASFETFQRALGV